MALTQYVYSMPDRRLPSADNGHRNRAANPPPTALGVGRIVFFARIHTIRAALTQGWPLMAVDARHIELYGYRGVSGGRRARGRLRRGFTASARLA